MRGACSYLMLHSTSISYYVFQYPARLPPDRTYDFLSPAMRSPQPHGQAEEVATLTTQQPEATQYPVYARPVLHHWATPDHSKSAM